MVSDYNSLRSWKQDKHYYNKSCINGIDAYGRLLRQIV